MIHITSRVTLFLLLPVPRRWKQVCICIEFYSEKYIFIASIVHTGLAVEDYTKLKYRKMCHSRRPFYTWLLQQVIFTYPGRHTVKSTLNWMFSGLLLVPGFIWKWMQLDLDVCLCYLYYWFTSTPFGPPRSSSKTLAYRLVITLNFFFFFAIFCRWRFGWACWSVENVHVHMWTIQTFQMRTGGHKMYRNEAKTELSIETWNDVSSAPLCQCTACESETLWQRLKAAVFFHVFPWKHSRVFFSCKTETKRQIVEI